MNRSNSIAADASFRLLFDANPAPMLVIDRNTLQILDVNDASLAFYGYDKPTFLTLTLPAIRPERTEGEIEGMDLHEHGISAYPEYVISALSAPMGMGADTVHIPSPGAKRELVGSHK